jgi:hypothetical protein
MIRMTAFTVSLSLVMSVAHAQNSVDSYQPVQVLRKPIRPITDPKIVAAAEAEIDDDELVIGVEVGGEARAYPINQLTGPQREIVNDTLGGTAIAATW